MLGPLNLKLDDYLVSHKNGFLPDELPLARLPDTYYACWEAVLSQLPALLKSASLRIQVDSLPILTTSRLTNEREWQRAYLILAYFTHAYIWEAGGPSETLPAQISIPFLEVASHLGLPPTATYAAFNLWNYTTIDRPNKHLDDLSNLRSLHTFTGTRDEEWFYLVSVAIEAHGATIIPVMLSAMSAVRADNSHVVLSALVKFSYCIREVGKLLKRMDEECDPMVFYNDIRPFLAGSKNMGVAGLPRGVFYEEGEGEGEWRMYSGGSNAQSSLIQFFDVVLGVKHSLTGGAKGSKNGFLAEMRNYMPGPHRAFLSILSTLPESSIREYALNSTVPEVVEAYNFAVAELTRFRDIHIQIITRYIIMPSRAMSKLQSEKEEEEGVCVKGGEMCVDRKVKKGNKGLNIAVVSTGAEKGKLSGTGGTDLLPFLRQSRDETKEARVPE